MPIERLSDAQWSYHVLRGLISYHERMTATGAPHALKEDGTPVCENQESCTVVQAAARHDGYLNALKFALACVEEKYKNGTVRMFLIMNQFPFQYNNHFRTLQSKYQEVTRMSDTEHKIFETLGKTVPGLPNEKKEWLLGFAEGMAFTKNQQDQDKENAG